MACSRIVRDTEGCRGIQRDTEGYRGMRRDTEGFRGILRERDGFCSSTVLFVGTGLVCPISKSVD